MSEQIFISYRRDGGDIYAKAICDALKVRGFSVFYDFDSLQGGYFDSRIMTAIEECKDFVLVLPPNSLDRCVNEDDWVRLEIKHALKCGKNIIPILLPGFSFPKNLPSDIADVQRCDGVQFYMPYFDQAVIPTIIDHMTSSANSSNQQMNELVTIDDPKASEGLEYTLNEDGKSYSVSRGTCTDTEIVIPRVYSGKPVTKIGCFAFYNCLSLTSIFIPDSIISIGDHAFSGCLHLKSIAVPNNVTSIGNQAFCNCISLASITISDSITSIEEYTFFGCALLKSITIPNNVTSIENGAFSRCSSLASITIPERVRSIGDGAFSCCSSLASITIPNSVTKIGLGSFQFCSSLKSITIPNSVMIIETHAFWRCKKLTAICFNGKVEQWKKIKLDKCWSPYHIKIVTCTNGDYKIQRSWI